MKLFSPFIGKPRRRVAAWASSASCALWLLVAGISLLSSLSASAYTHTVCLRAPVATIDSGIGEDYFSELGLINRPLRWTQFAVTRFGGLVTAGYTNSAGCASFVSPYSTGFQLLASARARVPRSDNFAFFNTLQVRNSDGSIATWAWNFNPGTNGNVVVLSTNYNRRTNLLVLASESLIRFSDGLSNRTFTVLDRACPSVPDNSCNSGWNIYINPDSFNRKFLISHEIGHAVVHRWLGSHLPATYILDTGGANCSWTSGQFHGMHTKEYQSAALSEGFAQYYSASVWNWDGQTGAKFFYYKPAYKFGAVAQINVENGPLGGATAYLETQCTGSDVGRGVELDWMRALWDYRTNSGSKPTRFQILQQLKRTYDGALWSNNNAGNAFGSAIAGFDAFYGTNFHDRWISMASYNGVLH